MGAISPAHGLAMLKLAFNMNWGPVTIANPFQWSRLFKGARTVPSIFNEHTHEDIHVEEPMAQDVSLATKLFGLMMHLTFLPLNQATVSKCNVVMTCVMRVCNNIHMRKVMRVRTIGGRQQPTNSQNQTYQSMLANIRSTVTSVLHLEARRSCNNDLLHLMLTMCIPFLGQYCF